MGFGDKVGDMADKAKEKFRGGSEQPDESEQQQQQGRQASGGDDPSRMRDQAQETGESYRDQASDAADRTRDTFDR